ncbi:uncharacterized protein N7477_004444 [Penicillium maclennaniae]|uniref:uncharacterized protein n=1 Tax=Penicillium maclennaniae TaxID=1343394 RepID=UPI002541046E|nr:uncharacterized protein N7477_004444 [Penicillium maclennaniae]KAJ5674510.1 hypothetical protein N7477_004444 [Penicillium maclennaniae]
MSGADKERVAKQTAALGGQPLYSAFLFPTNYGIEHGPFLSDDELWAEMSLALFKVLEDIRLKLR